MRVVTLNANGIRSAARRGFFAWAQTLDADVICLQETRAQEHQLLPESAALRATARSSWMRRNAVTAASRSIRATSRGRCAERWAGTRSTRRGALFRSIWARSASPRSTFPPASAGRRA